MFLTNYRDGFHISEYMYAMGLLDPRIRPFVFMVRQWMKGFEVARYRSRESFTNFQLSYMCFGFLQQLNQPLVPTFDEVMHQIHKNDSRSVSNIINSEFIFDFDKFQFETKNTSNILELFTQFLEYYELFDFTKHMVTIRTMEKIPKPGIAPLFLENVFDTTNPWGGNVSEPECCTMKILSRETLDKLKNVSTKPSGNDDWGLLKIMSKLK